MTDDEALETLFAMANVQDGYAKKATDPGLKVIHKANAKAQREIAATIKDLRVRLAAQAEADRDRLAAATAALQAQVARLVGTYWKLRSYAIHDDNCKVNKPPYKVGSCSCGLSKELKDGEIAALAAVQADAPTEYERKVAQMKEDFPNGI